MTKIKKLWERYREVKIPAPIITPFSYEKQNKGEVIKPLDMYNRIKASLKIITGPANKNEYENYISQKSYDPGIKGALI